MFSLTTTVRTDFIDFVLVKLWDPMSHMFKELRPCYDNLISNRKMYQKRFETGQSFVPSRPLPSPVRHDKYITITFKTSEPLGLELSSRAGKKGVVVKEIFEGTHAEKAGLSRGYVVSRVGGNFVEFDNLSKVVKAIREAPRPLDVVFRPGEDVARLRRHSSKNILPPIAVSPSGAASGGGPQSHDMRQIFTNMNTTRSKYVLAHNVNRAKMKFLGFAQKTGGPAKAD
jgi:hypothetical protein